MDSHGCRIAANSDIRAAAASDNVNPGYMYPTAPIAAVGCLVARDLIPRHAAPGPVDLELQAVDSLYKEPFFSSNEYAGFSSTSTNNSSQPSPGTSFEHPDWQYKDWVRTIPRYVPHEESEKPDRNGC
ncbi:hypothetical protein HDV63DRAFT_406746 [Trichoderma sp. SZMC 28014]